MPSRTALALAALLLGSCALMTFAGEATKRGRLMDITWREPDGTVKEVHAREIRYVYSTRAHFSKPKNGKTFKDSTIENKGIPLKGSFLAFDQCDRFDFQWSQPGEEGPALRIHFKKVGGNVVVGAGNEIAGVNHPTPPYLTFFVDDREERIDLPAVAPAAQREGKRLILSMVCTL
jgi:hypothetical protein